jgi:hypothetical protein
METSGSAAVGYSSIVACMISFGEIPAHPLPRGVQLDWEAILTLSPAEFIEVAVPLLENRVAVETFIPPCWLEVEKEGEQQERCQVSNLITTARDAIYLMNGMYVEK